MREELKGFDQNYQYGSDPKIDHKIDELNEVTYKYGGGIRILENQGAILELSENVPEDVVLEARQAASNILVAMGSQPLDLEENIKNDNERKLINKIVNYTRGGNFESILNMMKTDGGKKMCQLIIKAFSTIEEGRFISSYTRDFVETALNHLEQFERELKDFIQYFWERKENPRFLTIPREPYTLFLDDDGEIIKFFESSDYEKIDEFPFEKKVGETLKYTVLTGDNKGQQFQATHKDKPNYRPIKELVSYFESQKKKN